MAQYRGVISGIGDLSADINVIEPNHDAAIRNFIVGKDCILHGLELLEVSNGWRLNAGLCMAQGYVGELPNEIIFETRPQKIYAVFNVKHDRKALDVFYIETDPSDALIMQPNILDYAGVYWLLLYENGERKVDRDYPENAVNSDTSNRLIEHGTIAANATVEGELPETLTYGKNVASTEFVQRVVNEQILGIELTEYNVNSSNKDITSLKYSIVGFSKFVLLHITISVNTINISLLNNETLFTVDNKYRPITQQPLVKSSNYIMLGRDYTSKDYHITPNGEVIATDSFNENPHEYYFFYRRDI